MRLKKEGFSIVSIAKLIGISRSSVYSCLNIKI
ncbi:helix-turn-helix domain-containing protein [Entomobacter blattae]